MRRAAEEARCLKKEAQAPFARFRCLFTGTIGREDCYEAERMVRGCLSSQEEYDSRRQDPESEAAALPGLMRPRTTPGATKNLKIQAYLGRVTEASGHLYEWFTWSKFTIHACCTHTSCTPGGPPFNTFIM